MKIVKYLFLITTIALNCYLIYHSTLPSEVSSKKSEVVTENLMDVVTGLSGSSPAFIFMIIEAMADGAVLEGMQRDKAYKFAAQTVLGSAKMVLETGKHPGELKDMVCSPAGTTIEGVAELERLGLRTSIINAVKVATEKSKNMGK